MNTIECDVYKSTNRKYLYLFVPADEGLSRVPFELLEKFGKAEKAVSFMLTKHHTLAKEDPMRVLDNLEQFGYHLQLPPADQSLV